MQQLFYPHNYKDIPNPLFLLHPYLHLPTSLPQCVQFQSVNHKNEQQSNSSQIPAVRPPNEAIPNLHLLFTFLLFVFRSSSSTNLTKITQTQHLPLLQPTYQPPCTKLPPNISQTLIHYATSKRTPQQTLAEISVTERVLRLKSPCNFLVFGLGHDSLLWSSLNSGGRTLFLEESPKWIRVIHSTFPDLDFRHVSYSTELRQADDLLRSAQSSPSCAKIVDPRESECVLALKSLPDEVYEVDWDVIMVDAPTGFDPEAPGRMTAIYAAGLMARNRRSGGETEVMVHDVERAVCRSELYFD